MEKYGEKPNWKPDHINLNWISGFQWNYFKFRAQYFKIQKESEKTQNMKNLNLKLLYIFDVYKNLRIVQKSSETLSWKIDKDASSLKPTETQYSERIFSKMVGHLKKSSIGKL